MRTWKQTHILSRRLFSLLALPYGEQELQEATKPSRHDYHPEGPFEAWLRPRDQQPCRSREMKGLSWFADSALYQYSTAAWRGFIRTTSIQDPLV